MEHDDSDKASDSWIHADDKDPPIPNFDQLDLDNRQAGEPTLPNSVFDQNAFYQSNQPAQTSPADSNATPSFAPSEARDQQCLSPDQKFTRIVAIIMICAVGYLCVSLWLHPDKTRTNNSAVNKEVLTTDQPTPNTSAGTKDVPADDQLATEGLINLSEVGCQSNNLFVMSTISGKIPVDKYGNYAASFSPEGAQLVFLMNDKNAICASSISLPENQGRVVFNAESTAKASVFQSIGILSTDPIEAKQRLAMISDLTSFPEFYSYVKQNLPESNLAGLVKKNDFVSLQKDCIQEMAQNLAKQ